MTKIITIYIVVGLTVLGDPAKGLVMERSIFHKDHSVDVHILNAYELQPDESHLLAVNHNTDRSVQLELFCGLHGLILTRMDAKCYLVSPIVMIRGGYRPLKAKIIIPHALAIHKIQTFEEIRVFTLTTAAGIPKSLPSSEYKIDSKNCIVTSVINKKQIFAVTITGNLEVSQKSFFSIIIPAINPATRPPAITCVYAVFCQLVDTSSPYFSVMVYYGIDLPFIKKVAT